MSDDDAPGFALGLLPAETTTKLHDACALVEVLTRALVKLSKRSFKLHASVFAWHSSVPKMVLDAISSPSAMTRHMSGDSRVMAIK